MGIETALLVATVASTAMAAISSAKQGEASMDAARSERQRALLEAQQQDLQSQTLILQGREEAVESKREAQRLAARNVALGGLASTASPTFAALQEFNLDETEREVDTLMFNAQMGSLGRQISSRQSTMAGDAAIKAGRSRRAQGLFGAADALSSGVIRYKQLS